ncbi:hypothetical protein [Kitasatospora sp. NPDC057500]|uniref:hypothetical protein n=1 Tax=Kitasatospora sp. NPDC057500 TaxID=3346151 RepID=UPI0036B5FBE7
MNHDGTPADTAGTADTAVEEGGEVALALAGLARTLEAGPAPYAAVLAGGRRRVVRRRASLSGALALALVAALGGVAAVNGGVGGGAGASTDGATAVVVSSAASAVLVPGAAPVAQDPRDPLDPVRTRVLAGTVDGRPWSVWAALWPAPGMERMHEQARLIWAEDASAGSTWPAPTKEYIDQYGRPDADRVVFYYVLDGTRLATPAQALLTPPGSAPGFVDAPDEPFSKVWLGRQSKNGEADPLFHVPKAQAGLVRPDAARAEVRWSDGVTAEPGVLAFGDSGARWIAVAKRGVPAELRLYAADGSLIASDETWLDS